jgi:hypothetical protein
MTRGDALVSECVRVTRFSLFDRAIFVAPSLVVVVALDGAPSSVRGSRMSSRRFDGVAHRSLICELGWATRTSAPLRAGCLPVCAMAVRA